jgi:peptidoglycan-associated lipoprotein
MGPVPGSAEDFAVKAGDRVFFGFDSAALDTQARATLDAQATWLRGYPNVLVRIEGNTDERGQEEHNLVLGQHRAQAVRAYLASRGVDAARISTVSNGVALPIVMGSDPASLAQNRNARTVIITTGTP